MLYLLACCTLLSCAALSQEHLCKIYTLGPARHVLVPPWPVPMFCPWDCLSPPAGIFSWYQPLPLSVGCTSSAEVCLSMMVSGPLSSPHWIPAVRGIHLAGNHSGPYSWCIPVFLLFHLGRLWVWHYRMTIFFSFFLMLTLTLMLTSLWLPSFRLVYCCRVPNPPCMMKRFLILLSLPLARLLYKHNIFWRAGHTYWWLGSCSDFSGSA